MLHKAIKGYEDYLVTATGRVESLKSQKYLKTCPIRDYLQVQLWKNGNYTNVYVHRFVALVPGVGKYTLSRRLERGFTDFTLTKGENKGRHFKILGGVGGE